MIYLQSTVHGPLIDEIKALAADRMVPVSKVPWRNPMGSTYSIMKGCVAQLSRIAYQDLQQVISFVVDQVRSPLPVDPGRYHGYP